MISKIQAGTLGGQSFTINLANGGEVVEVNPSSKVAADAQKLADDTVKGITDGTIKVTVP